MQRHPGLVPLSKQHHDGLLLCVLTDRARAAGGCDIAELGRRIVEAFDLELRNHFDLEEELLFPETAPELAHDLAAEHRELSALVDQLRAVPAEGLVDRFSSLLRAHIRREESEWFEELQRTLPAETLERLGVEFEARAIRVCLTSPKA